MKRLAFALAAALCLGGCNMVTSDKPLFTEADTKDAPILKPGLWVTVQPDCEGFDPKAKRADWPKCARGYDVEDEAPIHTGKDGEQMLIAGRDPTIMQIVMPDMGAMAPPDMPKVLYVAMEPVASDAKGRVIEAKGWFVLCGPPSQEPGAPADGPPMGLTKKLLPGLTAKGDNCIARTKDAVRGAAVASRSWMPDASTTRWLREGKE